jgi:hypothetical protein
VSIHFDQVGHCGAVAVYKVEGYSPKDGMAHGSLDVTVAVCAACHPVVRQQLIGCGMTPYTLGAVTDIRPCRERVTYAPKSYTTTYRSVTRTP